MNTDDLTAAVARLRKTQIGGEGQLADIRIVLDALEAAQAATPPREPTLRMEPVAWMVGGDASTAAVYNAGEREQAFDAARRWNKCISGLVWSYNTPALQNSQASGSTDGRAAIGMEPAEAMPECGAMASPTAGIKPGPLDPIADLCARLRDEYEGCPSPVTTARVATLREAADALERLRAERAEAERDTLREVVRAADEMRAADSVGHEGTSRTPAPWSVQRTLAQYYDSARAKANTTEGEK